jgi:hemoglobin-like flavoprotein
MPPANWALQEKTEHWLPQLMARIVHRTFLNRLLIAGVDMTPGAIASDHFTEAHKAAWAEAYTLLAGVMRSAASETSQRAVGVVT